MKKQSGFTLIELMIVVAIIAILAAIALPAYQNYTRESRYSEVITTASNIKTGIEVCVAKNQALTSCDTWSEIRVPSLAGATANVSSAAITANTAVITVTGTAAVGSQTCVMTPSLNATSGRLSWTYANTGTTSTSGGCEYKAQ